MATNNLEKMTLGCMVFICSTGLGIGIYGLFNWPDRIVSTIALIVASLIMGAISVVELRKNKYTESE